MIMYSICIIYYIIMILYHVLLKRDLLLLANSLDPDGNISPMVCCMLLG